MMGQRLIGQWQTPSPPPSFRGASAASDPESMIPTGAIMERPGFMDSGTRFARPQ
jgi:hypothetical protein